MSTSLNLESDVSENRMTRRKAIFISLLAACAVACIGIAIIYTMSGSVRTDVAFVGTKLYDIKSPSAGTISRLSLYEFQTMTAKTSAFHIDSDELFQESIKGLELDKKEIQISLLAAEIELQEAQLSISQKKTEFNAQKSIFTNVNASFHRASELRLKSLISQADLDDISLSVDIERAKLAAAELALQSAYLLAEKKEQAKQALHVKTKQLEHNIETAITQERRTTVVLANDTTIAKILKTEGQWVDKGDIIAHAYSPLDTWIDAYIDEHDLNKIAPGATAEVIFDSMPSIKLSGTVQSISPIGGGILSPLSPNYSSGHVLRVTQRYIARIPLNTLVSSEPTKAPLASIIRPGMSARVRIQIP